MGEAKVVTSWTSRSCRDITRASYRQTTLSRRSSSYTANVFTMRSYNSHELESKMHTSEDATGYDDEASYASSDERYASQEDTNGPQLSDIQKQSCIKYMNSRVDRAISCALAPATIDPRRQDISQTDNTLELIEGNTLLWEPYKTKQGVELFRSIENGYEVRGTTKINTSLKNVMSLLAPMRDFQKTEKILLGSDQVIEARTLASCTSTSETSLSYNQCNLRYLAVKNPFASTPVDLVFLDHTNIIQNQNGPNMGYRVMESIRLPEFESILNTGRYLRVSIRYAIYLVKETSTPGIVEVTYASRIDFKRQDLSVRKQLQYLDMIATRLMHLRNYAEQLNMSQYAANTEFSTPHSNRYCCVCTNKFSLFRRLRHKCQVCHDPVCSKCIRKMPMPEANGSNVRICLSCILHSRTQIVERDTRVETYQYSTQRGVSGNTTWIAYEEDDEEEEGTL